MVILEIIKKLIQTYLNFALDYEGYRFSENLDKTKPKTIEIGKEIKITREQKENWLQEKINKFSDIIIYKDKNDKKYYIYKISIPEEQTAENALKLILTPILYKNTDVTQSIISISNWGKLETTTDNYTPLKEWTYGNYRFYKGTYDLNELKKNLAKNKWKTDDKTAMDEYAEEIKKLEKIGNIEVKPHRLAQLNEIKDMAYYNADWDNIAWINDANPILNNKSNLVRVKDKKVLWFDKNDPNVRNKGVVCFGRKLDQNKFTKIKKMNYLISKWKVN